MKYLSSSSFGYAMCLFSLSVFLTGCSKPEDTSNLVPSHSLTWTINGVNHTAHQSDAYYFSNTIIAEKNPTDPPNKLHLEILLAGAPGPGFTAGIYTLGSSGGNTLNYGVGTTPPNNWPYSVSGTLNITYKSGNIISGNFNATLNGTNGTISGSFTNLSIQ
jgi:hypothetical protein